VTEQGSRLGQGRSLRSGVWVGSMKAGGVNQGMPSLHVDGPAVVDAVVVVVVEQAERYPVDVTGTLNWRQL
jgi:hypothetical protein